ncbi:uncharacterized protein CTRU02_215632 [Colletotrichum truncatum]|uniref:Uncharacterized protein n=1 Tax=Colletotrichum truncatum TaxID=5467 RepID=A0ACC3YC90_COLTU|nr:uncharacterized protein CTRU02_05428 [Colletotrichum truncatum]KAF6793870.1 hypothetical protein CTRU02_05428 [Colletotrichum truncatum]
MTNMDPIHAGWLSRALILSAVRVEKVFRKVAFWKPPAGLPSLFGLCIKVKPNEDLAEARAMLFVAEHTSVPVPKLYCAFIHQGSTYIVMSRIRGQMAWLRWKDRSEASRRQVLRQLREMVIQIRTIAPPADTGVANVDGGPIYDCRLPKDPSWGPYATMQDFHKELVNCNDLSTRFGSPYEDLNELLEFYQKFNEHPVFTHGDLSSLNILVRGDDVVGIVDWETAGWLPPYWEYTSAWFVNPQNPFWQAEVDRFLTPMSYELKMEKIRRKYFNTI